jgi:lysylphosphatidylglycerol synthetase-like protein (DUF2156 family)
MTSPDRRDLAAGAIFIALGALFALGTRDLDMGTPLRMGPGFFPLILACLLMLLGAVMAVKAFVSGPDPHAPAANPIPWRGLILILIAPIVFGITIAGLGLAGAVALAVAISSFASRRMDMSLAVMLVIGLTAFCTLVFHYGLGLPVRLVGPWLGG